MTDEVETPAVPVITERKTPGKGVQITAFILGIISFGVAAASLICTLAVPGLAEITRQVLWWGGWVFLVGEIIITFIFSSKKYRPAKPIVISGFLGLFAAIMLLVSTFLR
ncbi:MAG TPA: hypothetical protein O0X42_01055 [Methanocorpusculum sp.]|nr:hypothetical protein [Methanocorpusculum sp.]